MPTSTVYRALQQIALSEFADLVLLDLETLQENTDFRNPARPPQGIHYVLVNGGMVCEKGTHTGARPGRVLRHS
jgi:N-acyl-D-amino-acid deacylase